MTSNTYIGRKIYPILATKVGLDDNPYWYNLDSWEMRCSIKSSRELPTSFNHHTPFKHYKTHFENPHSHSQTQDTSKMQLQHLFIAFLTVYVLASPIMLAKKGSPVSS